MKKFSSFLLGAVMVMAFSINATALDREHTLKVYNWADYIDEDVLKAFPAWYKQMTGEDVDVKYSTFDINESMLTKIEVGHEDYDVICPSEYIIERMLRNGLLKKIDKAIIPDSLQNFDNVAPFAVEKFQQMSKTETVSDYAVGYMWGTTGFIYNPKFVNREDLKSWSALLDPKFKGRIFMKDAFRDVYSVIVLYAYREDIENGLVSRDELVEHITKERLDSVESILQEAKRIKNIAGWEVDFGKEEMVKGDTWLNLSWSGDAQWAIQTAWEENQLELDYIVPQEGSNVWFDGWCIPKYAVNTKAATWFINYLCDTENALKNQDFIGYVSVIGTPEMLEAIDDEEEWEETIDLSYFFGEEATAVHANPVLYADKATIDRCALMHDTDEMNEELVKMWNRVKGDNLSTTMIIIVVVIVIMLVVFICLQFVNSRNRKNAQLRKRKR